MADDAPSGPIPSVRTSGSIFAAITPSAPEWRKIIKITDDGKTEVVQDWTKVDPETRQKIEAALADMADADDTPEQQQLLMTAWQAMAMYLSSCDDEDKAGALNALKTISNLMADGDSDGPIPSGTFGVTMQTAASEYSCPQCNRNFASEQGLISHLKNVHAQREKTTYKKNSPNQDKD